MHIYKQLLKPWVWIMLEQQEERGMRCPSTKSWDTTAKAGIAIFSYSRFCELMGRKTFRNQSLVATWFFFLKWTLMHQNDNLPQSQWLKTTRIYSLEFLDVRVQNRSHWAKIRAFGKVAFPWKAYGRICFLTFFLVSRGRTHFLACDLLKSSEPANDRSSVSHAASLGHWFSSLPLLFLKTPCDYIRPSWIIEDTLPISRSAEQQP